MRIEKFTNLYRDVTKEGTKIPQEKYCLTGQFPIVDQGQRVIAGWWNDDAGIFKNVPAIIFGDHTRAIKYMEQPFFIGADGVKILRPTNIKDNPKYLYYALQAAKIPNLGYSRHFKVVKELEIRIYSRDEQNEIVRVLEKIDYLIEQRHAETTYLDQLVKSRFIELFGDPVINPKRFPCYTVGEVIDFQGGSQPDKKYFEYEASPDNIRLIQIRDYKSDKYITYIPKTMAKRFCTADDIMIGRYGPPIFQILKGIEGSFNVALMKATPKIGNKEFVRQFLKQDCLLEYLEGLSKRTAGQDGIQMDKLKAYPFPYPPIELQEQFAAFVEQTDKSKLAVQKGLQELEILKKSLMQQYFG
ncbi:MAG: restriction endonuclease subunit S [Acutalibacteraceae bacterium]